MEVRRVLKHGLLENVYKDALELEFERERVSYSRERQYKISYKGNYLRHFYVADFVLLDKIILEVKAVDNLQSSHFVQVKNYLHLSKLPLGILVNFGLPSLQFQRIANNLQSK
jgi:GxxExxY protein